ncbi:alpha/beta fold hydrolase [Pseudonocardia sp. CA-142604]|uniref:alpha/beta fold hydrolase n=1 Tax=Pseudonocardia sp. CA-142604 TaxID=3240024 RepID=UPI003D932E05
MQGAVLKRTTSADGTPIGWRQLGTGPAIVIAHGAMSTGEQWLPVAEILAEHNTVMIVDRRGRGLSGDAPDYDLSTELADLDAVLAVAGPGATVIGHSYGAIIAAATAAAGADISALVLYEPPLPVVDLIAENACTSCTAAVKAGEHERALSIMLSDIVHMDEADLADLRGTPMWAKMVDLIPTLPRELSVINGLAGDLDRFTTIQQRTLLLLGEVTAQYQVDATRFLVERLPAATRVEIPEQAHFAHVAVPGTVADAVRSFLDGA